jgi:hypothetical protein
MIMAIPANAFFMNSIRFSRAGLFTATAMIALFAFFALAQVSLAATYAYVNTEGIVMTHEASDPMTAIATAPDRTLHSGVMLVSDSSDRTVVGDEVDGV